MDNQKPFSYRAVIEASPGHTIGSVHGGKKYTQPDITLKITCHHEALGPYLETKLTVAAPASMGCAENKYSIYSKLYSDSIQTYKVELLNEELLVSVSDAVRKTHLFDSTVLAYGIEAGKYGVTQLEIDYQVANSIHEGLFNNTVFAKYIDPETDEDLGDKPHIQQAINGLRWLYSHNGPIKVYIREEEKSFASSMTDLWRAMENERQHRQVIKQFYSTSAVINTDNGNQSPYLQIRQQLPLVDHPQITTSKTYSHWDFTDFSTCKGYASIQAMEYKKLEVQRFNDTAALIKFLTIPGGGYQKYLGVLYIDSEVEKCLKTHDIIWISFKMKQGEVASNIEWRCHILDALPWMKLGEVACLVRRPRQPFPEDATDAEKKIPQDYVTGHLVAGNGQVATDELIRRELDSIHSIKVRCRLESSDQTYRRQVYAMSILQQGKKLDKNPAAGTKHEWIDRPKLKDWQVRFCNKTQMPERHVDLLGKAKEYLDHLTAPDHHQVVQYLTKVPVLNNIAMAIIQGRAGVGKTFFIAEICTAMLRADPTKKTLVVTPSNEPCDVIARKIGERFQEYPETRGLLIVRVHNVPTEREYVMAYAKEELNRARKEADEKKTPAEQDHDRKRQIAIQKKKAKDAELELQEKIRLLELKKKRLPKSLAPQQTGESIESTENIAMNAILGPIVHEFDDEVVVSDGCFRADGSIDVDRLDRDILMGKAAAGLRVAKHLSGYLSTGERLIRDPRFQRIKQSLAWTILATAGMVNSTNAITDPVRWSSFRVLFQKFVEEGDYMDEVDRTTLDTEMKELRAHVVQHTSILIPTANNSASGLYTQNYTPSLLICDEWNRSTITDFIIPIAHYEPDEVVMVGDTKQLRPVVPGPTTLSAFLPELTISTMSYFLDPGWPSATVYIHRLA